MKHVFTTISILKENQSCQPSEAFKTINFLKNFSAYFFCDALKRLILLKISGGECCVENGKVNNSVKQRQRVPPFFRILKLDIRTRIKYLLFTYTACIETFWKTYSSINLKKA